MSRTPFAFGPHIHTVLQSPRLPATSELSYRGLQDGYRAPPVVQQVLHGQTRVLEPRSTDEINGTLRQSRPSHRGYSVDHVPKPLFSSTQRLDCVSVISPSPFAIRS